VEVAFADVNSDGVPDLLVAAGPGAPSTILIYNGSPNAAGAYPAYLLATFSPYGKSFTGGLNIATGDVNGDGTSDLVVAPQHGPNAPVEVLDGRFLSGYTPSSKNFMLLGTPFYPYGSSYFGGENVAVGNLSGTGSADIVIAANNNFVLSPYLPPWPGFPNYVVACPPVRIYGYSPAAAGGGSFPLLQSFNPFGTTYPYSIQAAVGDYNGDGVADLILGGNVGMYPQVFVYNGTTLFTKPVLLLPALKVGTTGATNPVLVTVIPVNGGNPGSIERIAIRAAVVAINKPYFWSAVSTDQFAHF
jgi:hypothetical protein